MAKLSYVHPVSGHQAWQLQSDATSTWRFEPNTAEAPDIDNDDRVHEWKCLDALESSLQAVASSGTRPIIQHSV